MNDTVSIVELAVVTGWSVRKIERLCQQGKLLWCWGTERGRNGRKLRHIVTSSLPDEVKATIKGSRLSPPVAGHPDTAAAPQRTKIAFSNEEEEAQARERFRVIEPMLAFEPQPGLTLSALASRLAAEKGIAERTLWRLYGRYRNGGLPALADQIRKDKGTSRWFDDHPNAADLAAYVYLEQRQSVRAVCDAIERDRVRLNISRDELPNYETVRKWLAKIPPSTRVLAREGRRAYRERMAPYVSRGYSDVAANQVWVSDHMIHDVEVVNDCFNDAPLGTPIRLRFTCILDFRSRYVAGVSWAWEGSSRSITTALRHAVAQHGPCEVFYCDNGKDYLKVAKGAVPAYLLDNGVAPEDWYSREIEAIGETGVLGRLGIAVQHCIVRHPQSKHVERFFRTLHERFDKKFPTYTGGSPDRRPDFTSAAMASHRKLMRLGLTERSLHPPASLFIGMCLAYLDEYNRTPHSGRGMGGRSPLEVFRQERNPQQRPSPDMQILALMLTERERRLVRECSVTLNKRRYIGDDEIARALLHDFNEREILIGYDPLDLDVAVILDLNGRYICSARSEEFLTQSPAANEVVAESMRERRLLERQTEDAIVGVAQAARAAGARSDVEHLAMCAGRTSSASVEAVLTHRRPRLVERKAEAVAPPSAAEIGEEFWEGLK